MQVKTRWMIGAAVAALAALLVWAFLPSPVLVETVQVTEGPFEVTIDEDARTHLDPRYVITAPLAARLQRIGLREGDPIKAGDRVAMLMPVLSPLLDERTVQEQTSRVGVAQANLQQARSRAEAARVALEQAQHDVRRTEQLAQQGFVAPTKIEGDRLAAQAAEKDLRAALEGERAARFGLDLARAALGVVRGESGRNGFVIQSPVSGTVLKVHTTSEATVPLGAPLIEIGDTTQLEVVAELLTTDALQIRPGSPVRIDQWGGAGELAGRLQRVEPAAFTKVSALGVEEQRVNAHIQITSPPDQWRALGDGFRVRVRIVTRSEQRALQVPTSAVFPRPSGEGHAVFVLDGARAALRPVQVLARNGTQAMIGPGLAPGTPVIVYPPAAVGDGVRVRLVRP
jgi:HlyD family secretion protein